MTGALWSVDLLLAVALVSLAAGVLWVGDLFEAVVVFIVFGLMMAVAWCRLKAVDIALAEAAIGAGLSGALLLDTLAHQRRAAVTTGREPKAAEPPRGGLTANRSAGSTWRARRLLALLATVLAVLLAVVVWQLPAGRIGLAERVTADLPHAGVSNPVTAVLLNFRSYDTWLEVGVLLLAVAAAWAVAGSAPARDTIGGDERGPMLDLWVRLLVPLVVLVSGYLLWAGSKAPGGAFQAGAVLCAAAILLLVSGLMAPNWLRTTAARWTLAAGFVAMGGVGVGVMAAGGALLEYPPGWAGVLILAVECVLAVSIAGTLSALFVGGKAAHFPSRAAAPTGQEPP